MHSRISPSKVPLFTVSDLLYVKDSDAIRASPNLRYVSEAPLLFRVRQRTTCRRGEFIETYPPGLHRIPVPRCPQERDNHNHQDERGNTNDPPAAAVISFSPLFHLAIA